MPFASPESRRLFKRAKKYAQFNTWFSGESEQDPITDWVSGVNVDLSQWEP